MDRSESQHTHTQHTQTHTQRLSTHTHTHSTLTVTEHTHTHTQWCSVEPVECSIFLIKVLLFGLQVSGRKPVHSGPPGALQLQTLNSHVGVSRLKEFHV